MVALSSATDADRADIFKEALAIANEHLKVPDLVVRFLAQWPPKNKAADKNYD